MKKCQPGFTLIELMIVISIIGILATMALPSFQDRIIRTQVEEALRLSEIAKTAIEDFYKFKKIFPENNTVAGLPEPEKIIGNYVSSVKVAKGVIDITLGKKINKHVAGKIVSLRPAIVADAPGVPIAWIHGYASVPEGMTVIGSNNSNVLARHLPVYCRY